ncbi:adenine phosphoribosyltransferase-like [Orbicella faveolata]|uniref:adenine phosphoribosyltransferase-like n=1 Tax=Orbicella faveolata TaxID=48498 RepID=UPI0009E5E71A|nr:adenine phosphoribosyltransferase-like [Orbicella faveolata]
MDVEYSCLQREVDAFNTCFLSVPILLLLFFFIIRDICPVLKDCNALRTVTDLFTDHLQKHFPKIDAIVGLDARGFLFGPLVSMNLNVPFLLIRKSGKLPGPTIKVSSTKEYGKDVLEIQADAIQKGQKVVVIDDLLATGGKLVDLLCVMLLSNMSSAVSLMNSAGGQLVFTKKKIF